MSTSISEHARQEELLPCPFCGGEAYLTDRTIDDPDTGEYSPWFEVGCSSCEAVRFGGNPEACPIMDWNTRAIDSATAAKEREMGGLRNWFQMSLESDSIVGSCQCMTKTPEIQYHKPGCKYRLISERDALQSRVRDLEQQLQKANEDFHELAAHHHATRPRKP